MPGKRNAPGRAKTEGAECLLHADFDVHNTSANRIQFLVRAGLSLHRARLVAPMAFGEACYG